MLFYELSSSYKIIRAIKDVSKNFEIKYLCF